MQKVLTQISGLPFTYFPHPVEPFTTNFYQESPPGKLVMGSYGAARHEKGNDILYQGISKFNALNPNSNTEFILQCLEGFEAEKALLSHDVNVNWLTNYFQPGEYAKYLEKTNVMLLPYRISSYRLRVSRVVIEAMINGIIVIATDGTTLADQAAEFGALVRCKNEDPVSVAEAINYAINHYEDLINQSQLNISKVQFHFSVKYFRNCFLTKIN
jgi:glycosyltransferase involved in cell wall biosynthesis